MVYPLWSFYPRNIEIPKWVNEFIDVVGDNQKDLQPKEGTLTSDMALAVLRAGLTDIGY